MRALLAAGLAITLSPMLPAAAQAPEVVVEGTELRILGVPVPAAIPGFEVRLVVMLRNDGREAARDLFVALSLDGAEFVDDNDFSPSDLTPGQTTEAGVSIRIKSRSCRERIDVSGTLTWNAHPREVPLAFTVPAACAGAQRDAIAERVGPRLRLAGFSFEDADGDGVPERGERLRLRVRLANDGPGTARGLRGILRHSEGEFDVLTERVTWPDLAGGKMTDPRSDLVVRIRKGASLPCPGRATQIPVTGVLTVLTERGEIPLELATGSGCPGVPHDMRMSGPVARSSGSSTVILLALVALVAAGATRGLRRL